MKKDQESVDLSQSLNTRFSKKVVNVLSKKYEDLNQETPVVENEKSL